MGGIKMKEVITIEEFLERIKKYYNEEIYIELEGDIRGEIKTKLNEVKIYRNVIQIIYDRSKRNFFGEKLEINIYKIEKIESDEDTEFYIYLKGGQKIIVFTDTDVWGNYVISNFINCTKHAFAY
jgi:hypothetical protein